MCSFECYLIANVINSCEKILILIKMMMFMILLMLIIITGDTDDVNDDKLSLKDITSILKALKYHNIMTSGEHNFKTYVMIVNRISHI